MPTVSIHVGNCVQVMRQLPANSVDLIVTSPPYFRQRVYGLPPQVWGGREGCAHEWVALPEAKKRWGGQVNLSAKQKSNRGAALVVPQGMICRKCHGWLGDLGSEPELDCLGWSTGQPCGRCYVCHLVQVFAEAHRLLKPGGSAYLNLGDGYAGGNRGHSKNGYYAGELQRGSVGSLYLQPMPVPRGLKAKDLLMVPARVALALQCAGWYLRRDIPWIKRNGMPESCLDRPVTAHEWIFLLTKSSHYYYDKEAVRVMYTAPLNRWGGDVKKTTEHLKEGSPYAAAHRERALRPNPAGRLRRSTDWFFEQLRAILGGANMLLQDETDEPLAMVVNTSGFAGAHTATFPPELIRPLVASGTSERGVCPECGKPWERVLKKGAAIPVRWKPSKGQKVDKAQGEPGKTSGFYTGVVHEIETVGWRSTCRCGREPVPAVVLDPFLGAGTTGLVAAQLGRDCIGIELNPFFARLAQERIAEVSNVVIKIVGAED